MDTDATPLIGGALQSAVDFFIGFGSDAFVFVAIAAIIAAFSFYFGRDKLVPLIAGVYAAIPLYMHFPYTGLLGGDAYLSIGLFLGLAFLGSVAFSGLAMFMASTGIGFLKVAALCLLTAGLMMAILINLLPASQIHTFSAPTLSLFSAQFFFWWLVAPVAGVFLFGK